ncbi:MAG: hypothetical protein Q7U10_06175 [Thermodesulfovibrionia bacterium]|nr:hypothetical protein [Thermodesulfovibrionia bacterium]
MEVASKFELHYYLSNNSHQINALLRNNCEAEILAILSEISSVLDIEAELIATAARIGGFREFWDVIKGNAAAITILLLVAQLLVTIAPMLHESEKEELEKELIELQIKESELNIKNLRKELKGEEISEKAMEKALDQLRNNFKIMKRRSNLYATLNASQDVIQIGFAVLNSSFSEVIEEKKVPRREFSKYILSSNKLKSEEVETEIEIVSPVLKEGNYKWKGIFNDQKISFDMLDLAFRDMVLLDSVSFQHGSRILCVLRIQRELDEIGDTKITGYSVTTVIEKFDGSTTVETTQGKKYRHAKKLIDGQGKLFS